MIAALVGIGIAKATILVALLAVYASGLVLAEVLPRRDYPLSAAFAVAFCFSATACYRAVFRYD